MSLIELTAIPVTCEFPTENRELMEEESSENAIATDATGVRFSSRLRHVRKAHEEMGHSFAQS